MSEPPPGTGDTGVAPAVVLWAADATSLQVTFATDRATELFGWCSPTDPAPSVWGGHVRADDLGRVRGELARLIDAGRDREIAYTAVCVDGTQLPVHDLITVVRSGSDVRLVGSIVTLLPLRRDVGRTLPTDPLFRGLVEDATDIVFCTDVRGHFTYVNPPAAALLGYGAEELNGMYFEELIRADHRERVRTALQDQLRERTTNTYLEFVVLARDGSELWVGQNTQLLIEGGRVAGFQAMTRDITDRVRMQEALADSERRYRLLADNAQDLIALVDAEGTIEYASPSFERVLARPTDGLIGTPLGALVKARDAELLTIAIAQACRTGSSRSLDLRFSMAPGPVVTAEAIVAPIAGADPRVLVSARDVTARREAEQRLDRERERASRLQAVDEARMVFLNAVAHDLRAPLAAILGSAATLARADPPLEDQVARELASGLVSGARRLERMLAELLDLGRLDRSPLDAERRTMDVGELVDRILQEWQALGGRDVERAVEDGNVSVDPVLAERIALNLLVNAAVHTPRDASICLAARPCGNGEGPLGVLLSVEDAGPGIPPELKDAIFEPFRRGPDAAATPGSGLGLWLVASFARFHGGKAWVEDRDGGGAAFRVLLPGS